MELLMEAPTELPIGWDTALLAESFPRNRAVSGDMLRGTQRFASGGSFPD